MRNKLFLFASIWLATPATFAGSNYFLMWEKASPQVETIEGNKVLVPNKLPIKQSLRIQTRDNSTALIDEENNTILVVKPGSHVELILNKENPEIPPEIRLNSGSISLNMDQASHGVTVTNLLGRFPVKQGQIEITFDDKTDLIAFKSFNSNYDFKINDAEDGITLSPKTQAQYQAEKTEEGLVFNYLLGGKKVAQGKWSKPEAISASDLKEHDKFWKDISNIKKLALVKAQKKKKAEDKANKAFLCLKPNAELNQCSWTCEGNPKSEKKRCRFELSSVHCVRRRCFADGEWKEAMTLDRGDAQYRCQVKPVVGTCN